MAYRQALRLGAGCRAGTLLIRKKKKSCEKEKRNAGRFRFAVQNSPLHSFFQKRIQITHAKVEIPLDIHLKLW